jgi:hypothetical protein
MEKDFASLKSVYAFRMPAGKVCLRAVMTNREGKLVWTGDYACSICGLRFHPDPADPVKLSLDFSAHRDEHRNGTFVDKEMHLR